MNPALEIGKTFGGGRYVVEYTSPWHWQIGKPPRLSINDFVFLTMIGELTIQLTFEILEYESNINRQK